MREILFRGKRKTDGKWTDGYYVNDESEQMAERPITYIYHLNKHPCGWDLLPFEVIPETVGQFTGLCDKNGKRIFEGDVIEMDRGWDEKVTYVVRYAIDICAFIGSSINYIGFTTFEDDGDRIKIIGNIHDNPELLEGRQ